ncbi:DNA methyltransferase [Chloroflexota bacterium]
MEFDDFDYDYLGYRGISIHPYPGTMPFPLAQDLVLQYSKEQHTILDPFSGSGTTLRAAACNKRYSVGIDINPLACLIAQLTTIPFSNSDITKYNKCREKVINLITDNELWPKDNWRERINTWFVSRTQSRLAQITNAIHNAELSGNLKKFVLVGFSRTIRQCSLARKSELKLWKVPETPTWEDPVTVFNSQLITLLRDIIAINDESPITRQFRPKVVHGDSEKLSTRYKEIDLVLTSPPYGDAWTTVAYGNFSMLNRIWLSAIDETYGESDPTKEDAYSVGGMFRIRKNGQIGDVRAISPTLLKYFEQVYRVNEARASDLNSFCEDMFYIFKNLSRTLKEKGYVVLVVGPRKVSGVPIDVGLIFNDFMNSLGLVYHSRNNRRISGKRLPSITSQGNIGIAETINEETIDVFQLMGRKDEKN